MPRNKKELDPTIYQLRISLMDTRPPIWRRVLVPANMDLDTLHKVIQRSMGWFDCHLHAFQIGNEQYSVPDPDSLELNTHDSTKFRLSDFGFQEKSKFRYWYDFGDDWLHEVLVEKILAREENQQYPFCVKAKRACPPEDCGGVWGYESLQEVIKDPSHPEYEEIQEWLEDSYMDFDPEWVDLEQINGSLSRFWPKFS